MKSKIRNLVVSFLMITTLFGNAYLGTNINTYVENTKQLTKSVTDLNNKDEYKLRYKVYGQGNELISHFKAFTVFSFVSTMFVIFAIFMCDKMNRRKDYYVKP